MRNAQYSTRYFLLNDENLVTDSKNFPNNLHRIKYLGNCPDIENANVDMKSKHTKRKKHASRSYAQDIWIK